MILVIMDFLLITQQIRSYKMEYTTITDAKYVRDLDGNNSGIKVMVDNIPTWVPMDEMNRTYREIMLRVNAGDLTITAADPLPTE